MDPTYNSALVIRRVLVLLFVLVGFGCIFTLGKAVHDYQISGILAVTTSDDGASITVSGQNTRAAVIGTGDAKVRLKPGTYQVLALDGNKTGRSIVTVTLKQKTSVNLKMTEAPQVPSVENIDFQNTQSLIDHGLTSDQVSAVQQAFFDFRKTAKKVIFNSASLQPGPHDPQSDAPFTLNGVVSVDSDTYKITISYTDLENARVFLYNEQTGAQIFDSLTAGGTGE